MSEKITRAQAEEALAALVRDTDGTYSDQSCESCGASIWWDHTRPVICGECSESVLRAYLAQQPSDDVVRKAHEYVHQIDEGYVFCECGHDFEVHSTIANVHGDEPVLKCDVEGCGCKDFQASMDVPLGAILAALPPMPEEK